MNEFNETRLNEKYPEILQDLLYGFECNDGWYEIIDELLGRIYNYISANDFKFDCDNSDDIDNFKILQIKEKFGQLRLYCNYYDEYIDNLIYDAERKSNETCELCGNKGKIRHNYWIQVNCDKCYTKKEK